MQNLIKLTMICIDKNKVTTEFLKGCGGREWDFNLDSVGQAWLML